MCCRVGGGERAGAGAWLAGGPSGARYRPLALPASAAPRRLATCQLIVMLDPCYCLTPYTIMTNAC